MKTNLLKTMILGATITMIAFGCTVNNHYQTPTSTPTPTSISTPMPTSTSTPTPTSISTPTPTPPAKCQEVYSILRGCHQVGIGQSANDCAVLTVGVNHVLRQLGNFEATVAGFSLMCLKSCALRAADRGFASYSDFEEAMCN